MTNTRIKRRLAKDKLLLWTIYLFAALTALPLLAILGEVILRGYDQISWEFLTQPTPTAYKAMKAMEAGKSIPGGIANGIIGTMIMLGMAAVFAIPLGIFVWNFFGRECKKLFCKGCKLSYRFVARNAIRNNRYCYIHLGCSANERLFDNSR